jgi:transposase
MHGETKMIDMGVELMDGVGVNGAGTPAGVGFGSAAKNVAAAPDPEVSEVRKRIIRSAEDRFKVVREFDACRGAGEKGAILRREGIYASYIYRWRHERDQAVAGLSNQKRGPKADPARKEKLHIVALEKQVARLEKDLKKCHIIIDVQKKLSEVLGITLPQVEDMPS